jgi:hypothetical protein
VTPFAAVNLEPPLLQFNPAGSDAEVTLTPGVPGSPCGPVCDQLICTAGF